VDLDDVQAVVQVLAERAGFDAGRKIAVGRRDDADVHAERLVAADPLELALLEEAQELHLHGAG
jgi:hypothetical protein